ncbi:hypothetical protein KIPB_015363 [Kipferlia bialata]|uniref:Uncharacterized protein n=1 Tax=Kipferlia bialata TaxID=797122 RepID=A0A391P3Q7_9EUKA|nr:hypothetical protein KIPB_015363 [Kipferlia bialata]|eukprot:g15363.t1
MGQCEKPPKPNKHGLCRNCDCDEYLYGGRQKYCHLGGCKSKVQRLKDKLKRSLDDVAPKRNSVEDLTMAERLYQKRLAQSESLPPPPLHLHPSP